MNTEQGHRRTRNKATDEHGTTQEHLIRRALRVRSLCAGGSRYRAGRAGGNVDDPKIRRIEGRKITLRAGGRPKAAKGRRPASPRVSRFEWVWLPGLEQNVAKTVEDIVARQLIWHSPQ
jgi:hypothetical protein